MNSQDDNYYYSRLRDIKLEDITSSKWNIRVLQKFRRGDPDFTNLCVDAMRGDYDSSDDESYYDEDEEEIEYKAEGDDLGWLGYFIGKSEYLKELYIVDLPHSPDVPISSDVTHTEQVDAFTREMSRNRSIVELEIHHDITDVGFRNVCSFVGENNNLRRLELHHVKPENESVRHFALMLEQRKCNSLQKLSLDENEFDDADIEVIATSLGEQASLEEFALFQNNLGATGCAALGNTLSTWQAPELTKLDLSCNNIDDAGLEGLAAGLINCTKLEVLSLANNLSITAIGLRSLAALFQSKHCRLREFDISGVYFGDEGAIALANGLVGNTSLEKMSLSSRSHDSSSDAARMTEEVGWSAFSKRLLCDTSSIKNTYQSNHTLKFINQYSGEYPPPCVQDYLELNRMTMTRGDVEIHFAAMIKILTHHSDLEMESLFKWDLKCLPVVVGWFELVREILGELEFHREENIMWNEAIVGQQFDELPRYVNMAVDKLAILENPFLSRTYGMELSSIDSMELSSIFKFVRAMPKFVVNSIRGKGKDESRKRKASD